MYVCCRYPSIKGCLVAEACQGGRSGPQNAASLPSLDSGVTCRHLDFLFFFLVLALAFLGIQSWLAVCVFLGATFDTPARSDSKPRRQEAGFMQDRDRDREVSIRS